MAEEEEEEPSNFTIIENDGSERRLSREQVESFFETVKSVADALAERDGGGKWAAAKDELNATVPGLVLERLGGYTPVQGYGTYQGEGCYFRARYQHASFSVGTYAEDGEVSSWMAKRNAEIQVCDDDDPYGAGYLTPADCVVLIRDVLVPNLRERTREQGEEEIRAFSDSVNELVEAMRKKRGEETS